MLAIVDSGQLFTYDTTFNLDFYNISVSNACSAVLADFQATDHDEDLE